MKIPDFLTQNVQGVFKLQNNIFFPAHTDMQELAASSTTVCTELETEEIFITLQLLSKYTSLYRIWDVRLVSKLYRVPYLLVSRWNTCTGGMDLSGKSESSFTLFHPPGMQFCLSCFEGLPFALILFLTENITRAQRTVRENTSNLLKADKAVLQQKHFLVSLHWAGSVPLPVTGLFKWQWQSIKIFSMEFLKTLCIEPIFLPKYQEFSYQLLKEESSTVSKCCKMML